MQSVILKFFAGLFHTLAIWFDESITGRMFNRVSAFLGVVFQSSLLGRFFASAGDGALFRESRLYKLLTIPVTLCRRIAAKTSNFVSGMTRSSNVVWLLTNWHNVSIRIYGTVLCAFSLCYALLRSRFALPTPAERACMAALLILSVLCILINRSAKSLFKGSRLLTAFGGLFCEIKKDADSKLFLKDPEFLLTRPIYGVCLGLVLAVPAAFLPPYALLLAFGGVVYLALVLYSVSFGVFTVIIAAPILPTMMLAACCVLTALSFFLRLAVCRNMSLRQVPLLGFVAVFALTMALGTLTSFTFMKSLQILFLHLTFMLFYFVAFQTLDTAKKWRGALIAFLLMSGLIALYGIFQNFAGVSSTASWVDKEMFNQIKVRVYASFDNPNVLGEYLVLMIPLALAIIWKSRTDGQKALYTALFAGLGLCMIFTWSRGAWLGMALAVALFLLIMDKRWTLLAVVGILLLPMLLGSGSAIADRVLSIGNTADTSTAYRVSIWRASVNMIRDFWLGGIGPGSDAFSMIYPKYALAGANYALHSHNLFLQLWAETGIAGISSFLALVLAFMRQALSLACYRSRSQLTGAVVIALAAGLLGFLFQGLTDNVWYNYKMLLIFWIVLAFASSAAAQDLNQPDYQGGCRV